MQFKVKFVLLSTIYSLIGGGIALMGVMIAHRFQEQPQIRTSLDDKVVAV